jgi:hypothetical protein
MESKYARTKRKKMWRGKSVIRSHNSKNRQCNGQMKNVKTLTMVDIALHKLNNTNPTRKRAKSYVIH